MSSETFVNWVLPFIVIYALVMLFLTITSLVAYAGAKNAKETRYYARWVWIGLAWPVASLVWLVRYFVRLWQDAWGKDA